jgi:putative zinc finger/helix-turn-helix YgiT family protein
MKCNYCNIEMERREGPWLYDLGDGAPKVTLKDAEVFRCPECGKEGVGIKGLGRLHDAVAAVIAKKESRLIPAEIRFLREHLGWSGAEFARQFEVTPQTVSRWENGKQAMGPTAEKLLRMYALFLDADSEEVVPFQIKGEEAEPLPRLMAVRDGTHWKVESTTRQATAPAEPNHLATHSLTGGEG